MRLARETGQTLTQVMDGTGARQFLIWQADFRRRDAAHWSDTTPDQWYMAQVAQAVRQLWNPRSVKLANQLLKFKTQEAAPISPELRLQRSMMFWSALTTAAQPVPRKQNRSNGRRQ